MPLRRPLATAAAIATGIILAGTTAVTLISLYVPDGCGNTIVQRLPSPDGIREAVLFERNCGATTSYTTQISITGREEKIRGWGNVFIADANHGAAPTGSWGGPATTMEWVSASDLQIKFDRRSRVSLKVPERGGVQVSYEEATMTSESYLHRETED